MTFWLTPIIYYFISQKRFISLSRWHLLNYVSCKPCFIIFFINKFNFLYFYIAIHYGWWTMISIKILLWFQPQHPKIYFFAKTFCYYVNLLFIFIILCWLPIYPNIVNTIYRLGKVSFMSFFLNKYKIFHDYIVI
jgi:hypothetical protein